MKTKLFSYNQLDTFIHKLSGLTKLICFILLTASVMFVFDIRVILGVMVISYVLLIISKVKFRQIALFALYALVFLITNFILTYLFSPQYGVELYGTCHELFRFSSRYIVTQEQLFYQITKLFKYFSVIPLGMLFIFTTDPSEFASSLNRIGVSYKACTSLALTLRYFPDVANDYNNIKLAQQARGLDMSKKSSLKERFKNTAAILLPLVFTTLDRVELISNAMDLRGYGKYNKRTWYNSRKLQLRDYLALLFCLVVLSVSLYIRIFVNKGFYYNPFVR